MYNKGLYTTAEKGATQGFALVTQADCLEGDKSTSHKAGSPAYLYHV